MSQHESSTPPQETAHREALMAEIMTQHDERMLLIVNDHKRGAALLNNNYAAQLERASPATAPLVFEDMEKNVSKPLQHTPRSVHDEINNTAATLMGMLSNTDSQLLTGHIGQEISYFGLSSHYVDKAIGEASSPTAQRAIRTILNAQVATHVQNEISHFGLASHYVERAIQLASSEAVKQAIKVSLDATVLGFVRNELKTFGVGSHYVERAIQLASSEAVKQAIKSSLDAVVLAHIQNVISSFGVDSQYVRRALGHGSSNRARSLMNDLLVVPSQQRQAAQGRPSAGYTRSSEHRSYSGFNFNEEDLFRDLFQDVFGNNSHSQSGGQTGSRDRRQQTPPRQQPSRHESYAPSDLEVEHVVTIAAAEAGFSWLRSENPINIRRVINTVRKVREQAAARGEEISDRDIYIRYRKRAQDAEVQGKTDSTIHHSFKLISALMGGEASGRLPF